MPKIIYNPNKTCYDMPNFVNDITNHKRNETLRYNKEGNDLKNKTFDSRYQIRFLKS